MSDETKETVSTPDTSKEEEKDTEDTSMDQDDGDTSKDKDDSMEKSDDEEESKKDDDKNDDEENNDDDDDEAAVESDDEPQVGSLEKPLVLEEGSKRERKKVERISFQKSEKTQEAFEVKGGKGQSLGDIPYIEHMIGKTKAEDLKPLHRLLFKRAGNLQQVKKNIRQFSGFPFSKDDNEYEKRLQNLKGKAYPLPVLKKMMDVLDVPRSGVKDDLVVRLMEWLEKPKDSGRNIPKSKRKRKSKGGDGKKKRVKKEKAKKETKKKKTTKTDDDDENDDDDDMEDQDDDKASDASDDNDDDAAASDKDDDDVSDIEPSSDEEEEPEPPKKKARKTTPKPKEKKPKKPTKKATPAKSPAKKKATPKKKAKVSNEEVSDISSDDSDDEPLVAKKEKTKSAPTNDELKDLVKKMLDNANLEQVTMKTVLKDVFAKYPDFDLTDRKDFIKNTVKQIIS